jgi:hypothetical protein
MVPPDAATVTVAERLTLPPAPLQLSVKVLVAAIGPRVSLPEVALLPDQAPEAVHEAAFVDVQLSIDDAFAVTLLGAAVSDSVGAGLVTVTVAEALALPPAPVQLSANVPLLVSAPVD